MSESGGKFADLDEIRCAQRSETRRRIAEILTIAHAQCDPDFELPRTWQDCSDLAERSLAHLQSVSRLGGNFATAMSLIDMALDPLWRELRRLNTQVRIIGSKRCCSEDL